MDLICCPAILNNNVNVILRNNLSLLRIQAYRHENFKRSAQCTDISRRY